MNVNAWQQQLLLLLTVIHGNSSAATLSHQINNSTNAQQPSNINNHPLTSHHQHKELALPSVQQPAENNTYYLPLCTCGIILPWHPCCTPPHSFIVLVGTIWNILLSTTPSCGFNGTSAMFGGTIDHTEVLPRCTRNFHFMMSYISRK